MPDGHRPPAQAAALGPLRCAAAAEAPANQPLAPRPPRSSPHALAPCPVLASRPRTLLGPAKAELPRGLCHATRYCRGRAGRDAG